MAADQKAQAAAHLVISQMVRLGLMPKASTRPCCRCFGPAEGYHHYKGYAAENQSEVVPVCDKCHAALSFTSGERPHQYKMHKLNRPLTMRLTVDDERVLDAIKKNTGIRVNSEIVRWSLRVFAQSRGIKIPIEVKVA